MQVGGLGIRRLRSFNSTLLGKLLVRKMVVELWHGDMLYGGGLLKRNMGMYGVVGARKM